MRFVWFVVKMAKVTICALNKEQILSRGPVLNEINHRFTIECRLFVKWDCMTVIRSRNPKSKCENRIVINLAKSVHNIIGKSANQATEALRRGHSGGVVANWPDWIKSRSVGALLLFCLVDMLVRVSFHPDRFDWPAHADIWWTVRGFKELKHPPDILMFGSSLMLSVTNCAEATYLGRPIDRTLHHRSHCLEDTLAKKGQAKVESYSFANGGQMASDAYAIEKALVDRHNRPKLIVWGVAPRDFVDSAFNGPLSSDTARYMNKIAGYPIIESTHRSLTGYLEQFFMKISFLFQNRADLVCVAHNLQRELRSVISSYGVIRPSAIKRKQLELSQATADDVEIGDAIVLPINSYSEKLIDNTKEYRVRYNPFKPRTFNEQLFYLEKFLSFNRSFGINVALVNMPLTGINLALMPDGVYERYLSQMQKIAKGYGAAFIDLNNGDIFTQKEFSDSAHLNGLGGIKLARLVADQLSPL